jgi:hypothetical protein
MFVLYSGGGILIIGAEARDSFLASLKKVAPSFVLDKVSDEISSPEEYGFSRRDKELNVWIRDSKTSQAHKVRSCSSLGSPGVYPRSKERLSLRLSCEASGARHNSSLTENHRDFQNGKMGFGEIVMQNPVAIGVTVSVKDSPCFLCLFDVIIDDLGWPNPKWFVDKLEFRDLPISTGLEKGKHVSLGFSQTIALSKKFEGDLGEILRPMVKSIGPVNSLYLLPLLSRALGIDWEWKLKKHQRLIIDLLDLSWDRDKTCLSCKESFFVTDEIKVFPRQDWLLQLALNGAGILCQACVALREGMDYRNPATNRELHEALREYFDEFGVLPTKDWAYTPIFMGTAGRVFESKKFEEFVSRRVHVLSRMPKRLTGRGGGLKPESEWFALLGRAGLVETTSRTSFGVAAMAKDGHFCRSMLEFEFCGYLDANKIKHDPEPEYNDGSRRRADFLVAGVYVEIAGLMSNPGYRAKMMEKQAQAKKMDIPLAILLPEDVRALVRQPPGPKDRIADRLAAYMNRQDL